MSNTDFLWKTLETINKWVVQADAKAIALLAANGVIAGIIFVRTNTILDALRPHCWLTATGLFAVAALVLSVFFAIRCVIPRLNVGEPRSVIFFRHISQLAAVDYGTKLKEVLASPEGVEKELTYQIWANSTVATRKHRSVAFSIWSLVCAVLLMLVVLIAYFGAYYVG